MQVQVETINSVTKKLNIEVPVEQVNSEIEKSYAAIQKRAKLQGFRPGKAPMSLVRRTYSDAMRDDVMRRLYEKTLFNALDENKIEPLDPPSIESDMLAEGEPFKYSATVEVMPEVKVKGYKGLELTKEKYVPSSESVEGEIVRMRENMAQLVPIEEGAAVENGHVVILDYTFSVDGFPEETQNADEAEVQVGANLLMPGFEEQLVGMKVGEERAIRITLPEGYRNPEAAGKEGVFQVTLKEIKRKELPELDDEFAQQFGEYENMEQLRAKLTEYREQHELDRIDMALKDMVIEKLIEKNPLDVPQAMVNRQLEFMLNNLKNRLKVQQMTLEMMGLNDDIFKVRFCEMAVSKVKGGLLLMALVEKEKIEAGDDELEKRYEQMASGNADLLEKIRQYHATNQSARERLISEIKDEKAIQFLLDNARITEVEAPAKQGE